MGTDVDLKRGLGDLLTTVRNHDDMTTFLTRMINSFGGVAIDLSQLNRLVDASFFSWRMIGSLLYAALGNLSR